MADGFARPHLSLCKRPPHAYLAVFLLCCNLETPGGGGGGAQEFKGSQPRSTLLLSAALHGSCQALSPDPLMAVSGVKVAISTRQLSMASEPVLPASCLLAPIKSAFICLLLGLGLFPLIMGLPQPQASSRCLGCRAHPLGCRKLRRTGESLLSLLFEENAEPFCSGLQTLW